MLNFWILNLVVRKETARLLEDKLKRESIFPQNIKAVLHYKYSNSGRRNIYSD
jgi:hypothetical protein